MRVAHRHFGYEALRPGQEEAIAATLAERDTLVVLPTGSGKSAIYQIAALLLEGHKTLDLALVTDGGLLSAA